MAERETLEVDVLIVGGGPAGMSAALRLAQLQKEKGGEPLAIAVLAAGWPVRRWVRGRRDRPLDPLVAARTVVFAKAAAYGGAAVAGWYAAQALSLIGEDSSALRRRLLLALLATAFGVGISAAGFVVQRWCRVPHEDDGRAPGR